MDAAPAHSLHPAAMDAVLAHSLRPAEGHAQDFLPGEIEHRAARRRRAAGIPRHEEDSTNAMVRSAVLVPDADSETSAER